MPCSSLPRPRLRPIPARKYASEKFGLPPPFQERRNGNAIDPSIHGRRWGERKGFNNQDRYKSRSRSNDYKQMSIGRYELMLLKRIQQTICLMRRKAADHASGPAAEADAKPVAAADRSLLPGRRRSFLPRGFQIVHRTRVAFLGKGGGRRFERETKRLRREEGRTRSRAHRKLHVTTHQLT